MRLLPDVTGLGLTLTEPETIKSEAAKEENVDENKTMIPQNQLAFANENERLASANPLNSAPCGQLALPAAVKKRKNVPRHLVINDPQTACFNSNMSEVWQIAKP